MKLILSTTALAAILTLSACGDDTVTEPAAPPVVNNPATPVAPQTQSRTERETREAGEAIGEAARATGDAAGAALEDLRNSAGPALDRAREGGARALDSAREGLNDLTRGAACQTARAADDAQGVAANC